MVIELNSVKVQNVTYKIKLLSNCFVRFELLDQIIKVIGFLSYFCISLVFEIFLLHRVIWNANDIAVNTSDINLNMIFEPNIPIIKLHS